MIKDRCENKYGVVNWWLWDHVTGDDTKIQKRRKKMTDRKLMGESFPEIKND